MLRFSLIGVLIIVNYVQADNWAVLVAGSNGWGNYRHQSDVCHVYQVLKSRGFPINNIITMMYDDIAYNNNNPMKGKIINQPYGPNVYKDIIIDYKAEDVTPANFINILTANESAMKNIGSGRVLKSGPEDNIFIFFVDHGGVGLLCFPSENLYADDLENTFIKMNSNKQFKKMLFFIDACESGSMFNNLLRDNQNILALTGAARDESSKGCYCSNPQLPVCLGDSFGVIWSQHMDNVLGSVKGNKETVWNQYNMLRNSVNESHVEIYGDISIAEDPIDDFFGKSSNTRRNFQEVLFQKKSIDEVKTVSNWDAELYASKMMYERTPDNLKYLKQNELEQLYQKRNYGDKIVDNIFKLVSKGDNELFNYLIESKLTLSKEIYPCYKNLVQHFNKICFNTAKNNYLLRHLYRFVNICSLNNNKELNVIQAMNVVCNSQSRKTDNII